MGMLEVMTKPSMMAAATTSSSSQKSDPAVAVHHEGGGPGGVTDKDGKVLVDKLILSVGEAASYHHTQTDKDMDAFLAGELNKMSLQERQRVFEEIHGVQDHIIEETPQFVFECLEALQNEISLIHPKVAYDMAEQINAEYVYDESFRLTFLRADMFDIPKAAKRLVTFFDCRLALFGPNLLTRSITLDDLNADDIATIKSGYFQILPTRDTSGRAIYANVQGMFKRAYKLALNMQRMLHYMFCSMVEDMETQLHGAIIVLYQIGNFEYDPPPDLFKGGTTLVMKGSPVRICGLHMCLDHPVMKALSRVVLAVCGPEARARYRFHEGSHLEVQYRLQSFGIPVDLLPITAKGELKKANHMKWLAMRKAKEEESTRFRATIPLHTFASYEQHQSAAMDLKVELPGRHDVLMGKGKVVQEHAGNVSLRALVGLYMPEYSITPKHAKNNFVWKALADIKSEGRFLKKHPKGWWILASDDEAREKIGKTFTSEQAKAKKSKSIPQHVDSEYYFHSKRSRDDDWSCFGSGSGGDGGDFPGFSACSKRVKSNAAA